MWEEAFGLLPVDCCNTELGESFKISELITLETTASFVRLDGRCFSFNERIGLPHDECCARVRTSEAFRKPSVLPGPSVTDILDRLELEQAVGIPANR